MFGFLEKRRAKLFGDIAIQKGLATLKDVEDALRVQKEDGIKNKEHKEIGTILIEQGVLTPNDVSSILEDQKNQMNPGAWFAALFGLSR